MSTSLAGQQGTHGWLHRHWRALTIVVAALLGLLVVAVGVVGWIGSERAIHPAREVEDHTLSEYSFAAQTETVHFKSLDGTLLAAWFVPADRTPAPAIVLLHGYGRSKPEQLPKADFLHRAGYNVLLLDFRNRGESGGSAVTMGGKEPLDVRAAVGYMAGRSEVDPERIAVQGVSLGASSGIIAMRDDPRIKAVVAEAAFTTLSATVARSFTNFIHLPAFPFAPVTTFIAERRLGISAGSVRPVGAIAHIGDRPALLISDGADVDMPVHASQDLYAAASGPKEFWEIPGATHAQGYKVLPVEYEQRVLAFYAKYLGAPGTTAVAPGTQASRPAITPRLPLGATLPRLPEHAALPTSPSARAAALMAYDAARGVVVLFGGYGDDSNLTDTWTWDGTAWTWHDVVTSPPPLQYSAMAYDAARSVSVLFGALPSDGTDPPVPQTWTWNGVTWTQQHPVASPPVLGGLLVYDAARTEMDLLSGIDCSRGDCAASHAIWAWDGETWSSREPGGGPDEVVAATYDPIHAVTVVLGTNPRNEPFALGTWLWDGTSWSSADADGAPAAFWGMGLAFDALRGTAVVLGGVSSRQSEPGHFLPIGETWTWDGSTWQQQPVAGPPPRTLAGVAYDAAHGVVVLFGGHSDNGDFNDTWTWDGQAWNEHQPPAGPAGSATPTAIDPAAACFAAGDLPANFVMDAGPVELDNSARAAWEGGQDSTRVQELLTLFERWGRVTGYHCEWVQRTLHGADGPADDEERHRELMSAPFAVVSLYVDVYQSEGGAHEALMYDDAELQRSMEPATDGTSPATRFARKPFVVGEEALAATVSVDSGDLLWYGTFRLGNVVASLSVPAPCYYERGEGCIDLTGSGQMLATVLADRLVQVFHRAP